MKQARWFVLFLLIGGLHAQTFRGGIQGTVYDPSGASVPGAQVSATNVEINLTRTSQTDAQGDYFFNELPLGIYSVTVTQAGFRTQTESGVQVTVSAMQRVDVKLTTGAVTEKIDVTADVPLIEGSSTSVGGTLEAAQISELPVNGRDFIKILDLVPGAGSDASGVSDSAGSFGQFSINGSRGRSNNFLLDGTDINDGYRNDSAINEAGVFATPATLLPIDAVQEVAVLSGTEAEYGRNSGAIVNVVTKSGTNKLHGSAFEYFRNNYLDARNFFNPRPDPQNKFQNNQFGGSLGGPIIHDRTFFFAAYEGQREQVGLPMPVHVPSQADIATAVGGGVVINPVIQKLLARNPFTNGKPLPATNGLLTLSAAGTNRLDSAIIKVDHHFNESDLFTGRYFFGDSAQSFPLGLTGGSAVPGYNTVTPTRVQVVSLSLTHVFSPRWLIEVRGGYNRFFENFFPQDAKFDPNTIGLATTANPQDFGLPLIKISGFSSIGANSSIPRGRVDTNYQYFTNLSHSAGRHNLKFGYEFRRTFVNQFFDAGRRGTLSFPGLNEFLMGTPSGGSQSLGNSRRGTFQNSSGVYVQDSFRLTPRLTLNYGLRWDYFGVIGEEKNRFSILDPNPTTGGLVFVGSPRLKSLYPKEYHDFSPRIGLALDVFGTGKTVLRAGYGLAYDAYSQDFFVGQLPFNTFNPGPAFNGGGSSPITFSFVPTSPITAGAPLFSGFTGADVFTVDQKLRTPYMQNYSLNIQQQILPRVAVQVGYVGSVGRHLFRYRDINQARPNGSRPFDGGPTAPGGGALGYVNQFESSADSNYNSLQSSINLRDWHGFTSTLNYTWSHSIDTASDGLDFVANAAQPDNSFNPNNERADSNFDIRHSFKYFFTYNFPKTSSRLTSGWGLDGVLALISGQPFSVTYQFEGDYNGTGELFGRPDVVGNPFAGRRTPSQFLNLSAFAAPCTPLPPSKPLMAGCVDGTQHIGNLRRNAFVGPHYRNFDLSLFKNTQLTERVGVQIRLDAFNIVNHPNFSNPVLPNFSVDFLANGIDPVTNRGQGFLPISATPDVGIGNPFLGGGGPRNLQLAVKFTF